MSLFRIVFILFLSIPVVEIYFLIKVGEWVGAWPTVLLVISTAVIGVILLRRQGLATFQRAQMQLSRGEVPATAMLEGLMLFFAGALLLTPGFVTDSIGFAMLIPPVRRIIARRVLAMGVGTIIGGVGPGAGSFRPGVTRPDQPSHDSRTIEGEVTSRDD